jgi:hypothetical protein
MKLSPILLALSFAAASVMPVAAQDASSASVPTILQITVEHIKPYKSGAAHDKSEAAFTAALTKAKFPMHYVGLDSMSGRSRALFMTRYSSFAEWEQATKLVGKSPVLAADLERAGTADSDLLDEIDSVVLTLNAELSYHSHSDLENHRVYQISTFHVRLGHRHDWEEVVKMVKAAHDKAGDTAHWGMYQVAFGEDDGTYVALTGDPSMSVIDVGIAGSKKFVEAAGGEEGMQKLDELYGQAVSSAHTELFTVNPKQSYVDESWVKADPDFWKPKAAMESAAAKPAAKPPAAKPGQ